MTYGNPIIASPNMIPSTAEVFSASTAYSAGEYVFYNGQLYIFTQDHAAGAWTGADAQAAKLADDVSEMAEEVDNLKSQLNVYDKYVVGKENLLNGLAWNEHACISATGAIVPYDTARYTNAIPVNSDILVYIYEADTTSSTIRFHGYDANGDWVAQITTDASGTTKTTKQKALDVKGYSFIRISEGNVITPVALIETASVQMEIGTIDAKANSTVQAVLDNKAENLNSASVWENGAISTSTGENATAAKRARTKSYLPENAGLVSVTGNRKFWILAYENGVFVGTYKSTDAFVKDGTETAYRDFDFSVLKSKYPNYKFRLSVYPTDNVTIDSSEYSTWFIINAVRFTGANNSIKVIQYNIGRFNMGVSGGLSHDVEEKIQNYKEFFAEQNADFVLLEEFTEYIDSQNEYKANETLFDPVFLYKSYEKENTAIKSQHILVNTKFSWIHTSGDMGCWVIYGSTEINGKTVGIASGVLSVDVPDGVDHSAAQIRALTKLTEQIMAGYDIVIIGMDTNALSKAEADTMLAFMKGKGYQSANWDYFGYKDTYNMSVEMYHAIDNIFVKGGKITNFTVPDVYADLSSDHFPVVAEIRIG